MTDAIRIVATNRKAYHDFHILEKYEAGIVLEGAEVKSIRQGLLNLKESFARILKGEAWLIGCHITPYKQATQFRQPDPLRHRKLLLKKKEIRKLIGKVEEKGLVLIPLSMYFSKQYLKVELALGKAKKMYDKRDALKERDIKREVQRSLADRND